jgi:hypothetical protein
MSTHWAVILADGGAAAGVVVAFGAARFAQLSNRKSIAVTSTMATVEVDRRRAERVPRLAGRLERWGNGGDSLLLSVWLESPEALAKIRVVVQEARNMDGPVGFKPGQNGVGIEMPWPQDQDDLQGVLPAWRGDSLRPLADWEQRMAPGTAAVWQMAMRDTVVMAGGCAAIRLKAMCWADRDGERWEVAIPVAISDRAVAQIDAACKNSDR